MNLSEFKAWFEGFTENIDGPPNERQWKKIKAKVEKITADPTPWPVFVDRYIKPYPTPWYGTPIWAASSGGLSMKDVSSNTTQYNANTAFTELGRQDFQEVN